MERTTVAAAVLLALALACGGVGSDAPPRTDEVGKAREIVQSNTRRIVAEGATPQGRPLCASLPAAPEQGRPRPVDVYGDCRVVGDQLVVGGGGARAVVR